jgi:hypothetical protein
MTLIVSLAIALKAGRLRRLSFEQMPNAQALNKK